MLRRMKRTGLQRPGAVAVVLWSLLCVHTAAAAPDPRLVLGLYSVPAEACSLAAAAGFTVVHSYEFENDADADAAPFITRARSYLDNAQRHGLHVLLGLPRNWIHERKKSTLRDAIRGLREHPALLAWYEDEIAQNGDAGAVLELDSVVRDQDALHGLVIEEGRADKALRGVGRTRMFTYYPVSKDSRHSARLQTCAERFPVEDLDVPFWPVLQAFGVDLIDGPARHELLIPARGELEGSLCSALIAGARGLYFYPYMHPTTFVAVKNARASSGYGNYKPLPALAPELWAAVCGCVQIAQPLLDRLAGAHASQALRVARAPRGIEVGRWDTADGTLVVIANLAHTTCSVDLVCDAPAGDLEWITSPEHGVQRDGTRLTLLVPGPSGVAFVIKPAR